MEHRSVPCLSDRQSSWGPGLGRVRGEGEGEGEHFLCGAASGVKFDKRHYFDKVKYMARKFIQPLTKKEIEKLLNQQTVVILDAVDEKLERMEIQINKKIDKLITTLDKFLKRMTDLEDEFELMKADLKRVKVILREKLGVILD